MVSTNQEQQNPQAEALVDMRFDRAEWWNDIACTDAGPEELSPEVDARGGSKRPKPIEAELVAKYCGRCPVWEDCLKSSIRDEDTKNIRGGLTSKQRKPLIKAYKRGNLTTDLWKHAIGESLDYMDEYYTQIELEESGNGPKRLTPRSETRALQENIVGVLEAEGSVFSGLAKILNLPEDRLTYAVRRLETKERIEKIKDTAGRIVAIKLVS
jgi:hypothetical protein